MNWVQNQKKLSEAITNSKCTKKECLSQNRDPLALVWFGQQYENKQITCTSCYVLNDQAVSKSVPTKLNILPVSAFVKKFIDEIKVYEEVKASKGWQPTDLKQRQKQHLEELAHFQLKFTGTLKALGLSLQNFVKRVIQQNQQIFNSQTFNEIIQLYSSNQMDQSLGKIQALINYLNYGSDDKYRFDNLEVRNKKLQKLEVKIIEISEKVIKVLQELLTNVQQKNQLISKN